MYHSPFHLIDPAVLEAGDDPLVLKRRLGLEKRKLLAEFELAGTTTIAVRGRELQRQDISDLFDELLDPVRLALHLRLWQHGRLLQFLETGEPDSPGDWLRPAGDDADEAMRRFISPYYAEAIDRYLQRCLQGQADTQALLYELRTEYWLLPVHHDPAYRYATRFFTEKKNELLGIRYRSEQRMPVKPAELHTWSTDQQIHVLNRLPDRFDDLRYVLTELLNNLCVLYDRQQAKKHALAAIERASTIRVNDDELERLVPSNLHIIRNKNSPGLMHVDPATGRRRVKIVPILLIFVALVRFLAVGEGCFDKEKNRLPALNSGGREERVRSPQEQSFSALIGALARPQAYLPADSTLHPPVHLTMPRTTGDDPFAPLFRSIPAETGMAGTDSSEVLLSNNSTAGAVFLLQPGNNRQRSIYILPGDALAVRYPATDISVHVYAGRDWDDSLRNSYLLFRSSGIATRQPFRGGFRTRVPISGEAEANSAPLFSRFSQEHATRDTLSLIDDSAGSLGVYYNLGED